ncbi:urease accessory protein UreE [Oscillatoriales cyanobacterium USR001]|nr:urease accessory protein UreE [Oscillatoriales cyanobacterium USR001]
MLILTEKLPENPDAIVSFALPLTAFERTRSRHRFELESGEVFLRLARGTVLRDRDLLQSEDRKYLVRILAKPEPVLKAIASNQLLLMRAAYHLGNRHIPVEITSTYLRLSPDTVLQEMLTQMGLEVQEEIAPFQPEIGAYGHSH